MFMQVKVVCTISVYHILLSTMNQICQLNVFLEPDKVILSVLGRNLNIYLENLLSKEEFLVCGYGDRSSFSVTLFNMTGL